MINSGKMIEFGIQGVLLLLVVIVLYKCASWLKKYWKVKKLSQLHREQQQQWDAQFSDEDH